MLIRGVGVGAGGSAGRGAGVQVWEPGYCSGSNSSVNEGHTILLCVCWQLANQVLNLAMIVCSALMIWKGLMVVTESESPVVVVLRHAPTA